jgi:molybdopterin/thiamine biosynthesis adenylyltransferase/rhodanese-related sulfurtransferase
MSSADELSRYQRQLALPEVGLDGQQRLKNASALIVGAGGLGSPAALYLAAAGIGTLGIVDNDAVEASNLHRQILHGTPDIGRNKAASAANALERLNPNVRVRAHIERLTTANALALLDEYDVIVDGSDNYTTRYAVNDACARLGKAWVYGSVERFSGQVSVFGANGGPCYRCIFPEPPAPGSTASCDEIGVLGAVPGVVGSLQAVEALKYILGIGELLVGRLWQLDLLRSTIQIIAFEKRADCPACATATSDSRRDSSHIGASNGDNSEDIRPDELAQLMRDSAAIQLLDVREPWEWGIGQIGSPQHTPVSELPRVLDSLDRTRDLIVYCHHGVRSGMAAEWLRGHGFRARNLAGGIDRWSREIDPSVARY